METQNDKITFCIGLALLAFVLNLCTGCATDGRYYRPMDMRSLQNFSDFLGDRGAYAPQNTQRREQTCYVREVPTLSGRAIYSTECE